MLGFAGSPQPSCLTQACSLPPWLADLNVTEWPWRFFKHQARYIRYYEHFHQFCGAGCKLFDELSAYAEQMRTLLTENFEMAGGQKKTENQH